MILRLRQLVLLTVIGLLLGADAAEDARKNAQQLQGAWSIISAIRSGQVYPPAKLKGEADFVFAGDTVRFLNTPEKQPDKITFKLDPTKKPRTIDMIPAGRDLEPLLGIYEVAGDTLRICFRATGEKRPTAFTSEPNSGSFLYVLKRLPAQQESRQPTGMSPQKKAEALGIKFEKLQPGYLNRCVKAGKLLFTSGHTSKIKGRLGKDLTVEDGYKAARESAIENLRAVWNTHGTLDGLKVVKVFGCVNSAPDFYDQPKVINGCSDLLHEIFGAKTDGWHARSALGFAALPGGAAVEIEMIFEFKE